MEKDKLVEQVARTPIESHRYKQRRYLTIECIERLISLIRPSIEQEVRKQGRKDVLDFFHENSVGVMMNEYALDAKLKEWGLSKEVGE